MKFRRVQFQKIEQIKPLRINPQSEKPQSLPKDSIFNKSDIIIPFIKLKVPINKLKELNDWPTLLIPIESIINFPSHLLLICRKVRVWYDIVEIPRKGNFQKRFPQWLCIIFDTPKYLLLICWFGCHLWIVLPYY